MRKFIGVAAELAFAFCFPAEASVVSFTGTGTFSAISGCNGLPSCSITNSGHQLNMSGFDPVHGFQPSTLAANSITGSFVVPPSYHDYVIGELTWVNRATYLTDSDFLVQYTYALSFSSPSVTSDSQAFNLEIKQTTNPAGDKIFNLTGSTLSNLGPFLLNGVSISDVHFSMSGAGSFNAATGLWKNPEGGTSHLYITADFALSVPTVPSVPAVPEPSTWAMMMLGFAGIGALVRRRQLHRLIV